MDRVTGRIISVYNGKEASFIIPLGNDKRVMILADDSCGAGKGEILRASLIVYSGKENITSEVFKNFTDYNIGEDGTEVEANADTIAYALNSFKI